MNKLQQVRAERVPIFLQEASCVVKDDARKVIQAEGRVDVWFRLQIISMATMSFVNFRQHGLIRALKIGLQF